MSKFWSALIIAGLFLSVMPQAQAQFFFMENQLLGKPAPEFKLPNLKGGEQTLTQFRQGTKVVIFFWATWCPHCREQLGVINKKIDELNQKGIKVAAVDSGEKEALVKSFVKKNNIKLDVFVDEKSSMEEPYNVIGLPTLVFVDQDGVVLTVKHSFPENVDQVFKSKSVKTK
jgi:peroxiredoxin